MEVHQLKEKLHNLNLEVSKLLIAFQKDTGVQLNSIEFDRKFGYGFNNEKEFKITIDLL